MSERKVSVIRAVQNAVARRDAEWRATVEKLRNSGCGCGCDGDNYAHTFNAALTALLAAMEAK